jgi:hypothetical protein
MSLLPCGQLLLVLPSLAGRSVSSRRTASHNRAAVCIDQIPPSRARNAQSGRGSAAPDTAVSNAARAAAPRTTRAATVRAFVLAGVRSWRYRSKRVPLSWRFLLSSARYRISQVTRSTPIRLSR